MHLLMIQVLQHQMDTWEMILLIDLLLIISLSNINNHVKKNS